MDVCDAVMSRRDLETRQKILKDSRVGAFAVICIGILMLAQFSGILSFIELGDRSISMGLLVVPVASRICAAFAVINMKPMSTSQYFNLSRKSIFNVVLGILLIAMAAILVLCGLSERILVSAGVTMIMYLICALYGSKMLGGMNGDISGYSLTIGELAGIIGLII